MNNFLTPPPFVWCNACNGSQFVTNRVSRTKWSVKTCPNCKNSPIPGMIPQYYTPEQYRDCIRRENGLPDYELPDDMPVWIYYLGKWDESDFLAYVEYHINDMCVIRNEAGRPPEDYKQ